MRKLGYLNAFVLPALVFLGTEIGGLGYFLAFGYAFLFMPIIDHLWGIDSANIPTQVSSELKKQFYYRFLLYMWVPVQLAVLTWCVFVLATRELPVLEIIGLALSTSVVTGGIGITVAHELGHKHRKLDQFMSKILLMTVFYMHFFIEHNRGHHVKVATPEDPATALRGESFYHFWVKTVFLGFASAWRLETERLHKVGKRSVSLSNQMIWFSLLPWMFVAAMTYGSFLLFGAWQITIPVFLLLQSIFAFTLLELVNYVEHYGLLRKEIAPGRYERVGARHSWNADQILSNYYLFKLQRHSDHHLFATKPYQVLDRYEESPQLPAGYPSMVVLALAPPLWFSIMNPRLYEWERTILEAEVQA